MASRLLYNIRQLLNTRAESHPLRGEELAVLPTIDDAWLQLEDEHIAACGSMSALPSRLQSLLNTPDAIDVNGGLVLPAWVDSHTHLVFAGSRESEFVDKIKGLSYADINARGGGILNSARRLADTSEDVLFAEAWQRLNELGKLGTGAIEIKSGYGLTVEGELKMLRVIRRLKERSSISIKASFLGAHTYPAAYREDHRGYIDLIIREMLPVIAAEGLADYIDVFCEQGFFSPAETEEIVRAGQRVGLGAKIHANQLHLSGGVETGVGLGALSVDHLETMDAGAIAALAASDTIGTLLPTAAFFLRMPFQPARALIEGGCRIALASDYNPGSSPSGNMNLVIAMACTGMRMLPEEAINAATINGAYAMSLGKELGSITPGKIGNIIITRPVPSLAYLPYAFGTNHIDNVLIRGAFLEDPPPAGGVSVFIVNYSYVRQKEKDQT